MPDLSQSIEREPARLAFHLRTLGICWIGYGIICLLTALVLVMYSGTATVMFGALLSRVPDPYTLMSLFHAVYAVVVVVSVVSGVLGILAGVALSAGRRAGRTLALAAAFFSLWRLPFGVTLSVYTLVVLLPPTSRPEG